MAKAPTEKDVLYALRYTGARLCCWPSNSSTAPSTWSLEPSGDKVLPAVASRVLAKANLAMSAGMHGEASYTWRDAA